MKRRRLACDRPVVARDGRTTAQSRGASTGSMTRRRRLLKAGGGIAVVCVIPLSTPARAASAWRRMRRDARGDGRPWLSI
jgi:hypothetical protein